VISNIAAFRFVVFVDRVMETLSCSECTGCAIGSVAPITWSNCRLGGGFGYGVAIAPGEAFIFAGGVGAMLETCGSAGKGKRKGCTFPVIES
jgi:hypothetical protein